MYFKKGVSLKDIQPQTYIAICVAERQYHKYGYNLIVTSVNDGKHKKGSLHYKGLAVDIRIKNIMSDIGAKPIAAIEKLTDILKNILCHLGYDVILELEKNHIHIEYDPK